MGFGSEKAGFLLMLLGALLVVEGIPYFGFPKAVREWAGYLHRLPEKRMRLMGFVIMATGIALLFAIRDIWP